MEEVVSEREGRESSGGRGEGKEGREVGEYRLDGMERERGRAVEVVSEREGREVGGRGGRAVEEGERERRGGKWESIGWMEWRGREGEQWRRW